MPTTDSTEWCEICDETEVTTHTRLGVCNACYSALYYWKGASVKKILQRRADLKKYQTRMALIAGSKGANE